MYRVTCIDDVEIERYGFLWLKIRTVKIKGLTKGIRYEILNRETRTYKVGYSELEYKYVLIRNDEGIKQWYKVDRFTVS